MADRQTLDVYARRAADYARRFTTERPDRHLSRFMAALPKGARVLDLGCGTGRAASFMQSAGLIVDAWDASPEMAAIGRETFGLTIEIRDFADLSDVAGYDGIYANFSLLHAPRSEMPGHLDRVATALKPDGLLHLGLKRGEGEARDALGRYYAYYQLSELSQLLGKVGLTIETREFGAEEGLDGVLAPWIILTARKTS